MGPSSSSPQKQGSLRLGVLAGDWWSAEVSLGEFWLRAMHKSTVFPCSPGNAITWRKATSRVAVWHAPARAMKRDSTVYMCLLAYTVSAPGSGHNRRPEALVPLWRDWKFTYFLSCRVKTSQQKSFRLDFLVFQRFRLPASNAGARGLIPGWKTNIPHATWHSQIENKNYMKMTPDLASY